MFLRLAPEREPGTVFSYNQGCSYTAGAIVQRRAGCTLPEYLQPRLFDIVGGGPVSWLEQPPCRALGYSGLHATHDDVVRLGQLYPQRGRWGSRQVLSPQWVDLATSGQIATSPPETHTSWRQGYGFQFWMGRHGYRGDGAYGQFCIVLPEQDAVVVITSATASMQTVLDDVYAHLLLAFSVTPVSDSADAELAARLGALDLPSNGVLSPSDPARWDGMSFEPNNGVCSAQETLTAVRVTRSAADDAWQLTLVEDATSFTVKLRSSWTREDAVVSPGGDTVPVAAGGPSPPPAGWGRRSAFSTHHTPWF